MTDKAGYRAVLSGKRDIVDNGIVAVLLSEILYLNQFDPLLYTDNLPAVNICSYLLSTRAESRTYRSLIIYLLSLLKLTFMNKYSDFN